MLLLNEIINFMIKLNCFPPEIGCNCYGVFALSTKILTNEMGVYLSEMSLKLIINFVLVIIISSL